jgi:hypothetical protein
MAGRFAEIAVVTCKTTLEDKRTITLTVKNTASHIYAKLRLKFAVQITTGIHS